MLPSVRTTSGRANTTNTAPIARAATIATANLPTGGFDTGEVRNVPEMRNYLLLNVRTRRSEPPLCPYGRAFLRRRRLLKRGRFVLAQLFEYIAPSTELLLASAFKLAGLNIGFQHSRLTVPGTR